MFVTLPFVVRTVQPVLIELDQEMEEGAASLGASRFTIFRRIILPNLLPAMLAGTALAFTRALSEFGSTVLISGNIIGKTQVAAELTRQFTRTGWRVAAAKLSGVACQRDLLAMEDNGAVATASFVDCGLPSTVGIADLGPVARGILDSIDNATSVSVSNVDISQMVGTSGDTALSAIITQIDKAIAKVTDSGTKLGANKTQIDGQKTFVDTLMKANDRTIGILVDADIEEESTKLKALQTQQQLAVQSLSIANSSSQGILSLFR